jgi:hypothetical protein
VQYTIRELLRKGEIDGELFPIKTNARSREEKDAVHLKSSYPVVRAGIKTMLGEMYPAYEEVAESDDTHRSERLTKGLLAILETQLGEKKQIVSIKKPPKPYRGKALEGLPDAVKDAFTLESAIATPPTEKRAPRAPVKSKARNS